jgi:phospholipase/lecithinase/hemolysin
MKMGGFMQLRKFMLLAISASVVLMAMTPIASATSYSSLVVYGDSLSDNGNLYSYIGYPPSPPYYKGRFSNGPVIPEQLASDLGIPLYDFAVGGATSGLGNYVDGGTQTTLGTLHLPGMQLELAASAPLLTSPVTSTGLFVVWGGANDFLTGGSPTVAAADIDALVSKLQSDGVVHILVPGIPDLGLTPDFYGIASVTAYSQQFNALLQSSLPSGATYVDTYNLLHQIVDHPGTYGLTDVKDPCFNGTSVCTNPNQYLFWDGFHPTTATDAIVAQNFAAVAATPEPSTMLLLSTSIPGLMMVVRRRWRVA